MTGRCTSTDIVWVESWSSGNLLHRQILSASGEEKKRLIGN
jgi:hypothetical protein